MQRISNQKILPWLLLGAMSLTACGNKGDLYLPPKEENTPTQDEPPATEKTPTTPATTDEANSRARESLTDFPMP